MNGSDGVSGVQWAINLASASAILTAALGWVPPVAAVVALVWYIIQISESATVQNWRANRRAKRIERLRAALTALEAKNTLNAAADRRLLAELPPKSDA